MNEKTKKTSNKCFFLPDNFDRKKTSTWKTSSVVLFTPGKSWVSSKHETLIDLNSRNHLHMSAIKLRKRMKQNVILVIFPAVMRTENEPKGERKEVVDPSTIKHFLCVHFSLRFCPELTRKIKSEVNKSISICPRTTSHQRSFSCDWLFRSLSYRSWVFRCWHRKN